MMSIGSSFFVAGGQNGFNYWLTLETRVECVSES